MLYDALFSEAPGLSDNAVQLLTGWGGGMIGVIGAYVGYRGSHDGNAENGAPRGAQSDAETRTGRSRG